MILITRSEAFEAVALIKTIEMLHHARGRARGHEIHEIDAKIRSARARARQIGVEHP